MKTKLLVLVFYYFVIAVNFSFPLFSQTVGTTKYFKEAYEGYTLIAPYDNSMAYLIDNCGEIVHSWNLPDKFVRSIYLNENGDILYFSRDSTATSSILEKGGILKKIDWNNNILWSFNYKGADFVQHHDIELLPNGNILILTFKIRSAADAISKGKTSFGNNLWTTKIDEIQPFGTNSVYVLWEWEAWNHLIQNVNPKLSNYASIKDNPGKIDINYTDKTIPDLLHVNSVSYNKEFDLILLSSKFYGEIYVIDHSTTTMEAATSNGGNFAKGGEILYRWGNPEVYDRGNKQDRKFFEQHDAEWIKDDLPYGGGILVFNNGQGRPDGNYSSADVLMPKRNSIGGFIIDSIMPFGPTGITKSYFNVADPAYVYSPISSSSQILPNGNALLCPRNSGFIVELSPDNEIVWEYRNPVEPVTGIATQGDPDNTNSFFWRAYRYPIDYPAFINKNMAPKGTVEFGTDVASCSIIPNNIVCDSCLVCKPSVVLPNLVSENPNENDLYIYDDSITSSSKIISNSGNAVYYKVGDDYIELKSGFEADGSVEFNAIISDCDRNN